MEQLLLFPETQEEELRREVKELRAQLDRVRKCQFAKIGEALRIGLETRNELEQMKAAICRGEVRT
jgi:hypothetical protein